MSLKRIKVVAAVITRDETVLIARKREGRSLAGFWEFPGGKIEAGESPESALARELFEEFSIEVEIGECLGVSIFQYPDFEIELLAYWAHHVSGEFTLRDHDEIRWVSPAELSDYPLAPADVPLIVRVQASLA